MKDLIKSFLNNKFTRSSVPNEQTPSLPVETNKELESSTHLKKTYLNKSPTGKLKISENNKRNEIISNRGFISLSHLDLFSYFTRKYFTLHKGIRVILDECENNLTYLNVYRKNNLKQFFAQNSLLHMTSQTAGSAEFQQELHFSNTINSTNSNQMTPNKSLSFSVIEEALQAKTK